MLVKNGASGAGRISGAMVMAYLVIGCSRPAFSAESTATDDQPHLRLAPIYLSHTLGGNIGYTFSRTSNKENKTLTQTLGLGVIGTVGVRSFFWQPWFAQVSTDLKGSILNSRTKSNDTANYNSTGKTLSGEARLNVLKSSRFPFEARIFRNDARYSSFYSGADDVSQFTGYNLNQSYENLSKRLRGKVSFTNSNRYDGNDTGPRNSKIFNYNLMVRPFRTQTIGIDGSTTKEKQPSLGQSYLSDALTVSHTYQPNQIFAVSSLANQLKRDLSILAQGSSTGQQYSVDSLQFSSFASLRPTRSPLTMTSSVRFLKLDTSANGTNSPTLKSSNFNLGANYLFSAFVRMYGSVNVADKNDIQTVTTNSALTASRPYSIVNKTNLGGFLYSGSVGGSISTSNVSRTDTIGQTTSSNSINLGMYLSHALDKTTELSGGRFSENLHQTLSEGISNGSNRAHTSNLVTGGSLSWNRSEGKENTQLRLSATDSRNLTGVRSAFQMANLQATRREALSRTESLQGNLTVQATHTQTYSQQTTGQSTPYTLTPSAEISYQNVRLFKVLHLNFISDLRISEGNIAPTGPIGYQDQAIRSWNNDFSYQIGVLSMKLNTSITVVGNDMQSLIMFTMSRPF